jgi:hypothetical protein
MVKNTVKIQNVNPKNRRKELNIFNNNYVGRVGTAHVKDFSFQQMFFCALFDYRSPKVQAKLSAQSKSLEWWAVPTIQYVD